MRTVADELDRQVRRLGNGTGVVVVCSEEMRAQFADAALAGGAEGARRLGAGGGARRAARAARGRAAGRGAKAERAASAGARALARGGRRKAARAAAGWGRDARGRVGRAGRAVARPGGRGREAYACPRVRARIGRARRVPAGRHAARASADDGVDVAVRQTLAHGGTVLAVGDADRPRPGRGHRRACCASSGPLGPTRLRASAAAPARAAPARARRPRAPRARSPARASSRTGRAASRRRWYFVLRVAEVRADQVEVVLEAAEVVLELGAVGHDLLGVLLDLHPPQAEHDHLEVGGEHRRRDGEHALLVRVREQRAGLAAGELVVDRLGRGGT